MRQVTRPIADNTEAVSGPCDRKAMLSVVISLFALVATFLQAKLAARDAGDARRASMDWWNAEDALVAEHRFWWRRLRVRRELRLWRDSSVAKDIQHVETVLASWLLLLTASGLALVKSLWDLFVG